jgi:dipeptidyl aminopeptidase/acylaminoacyl peptidase
MGSSSSRRLGIGLAIVVCALGASYARAQGTKADYDRSELISRTWSQKVVGGRVDPKWYAPDRFYYRSDTGGGNWTFVRVDCAAGKREIAFDHAKLAEALNNAAGTRFPSERLPLAELTFPADNASVTFDADGSRWTCDLSSYAIEKKGKAIGTTAPTTTFARGRGFGGGRGGTGRDAQGRTWGPRGADSPDGKYTARVKDGNLYLKPKSGGGNEVQLTKDATAQEGYEGGVFWAPDSSRFVALRTKKEQEHKVYMVESSPKDQLQPKLKSIQYLKPGDDIAITKPHLFDVEAKSEIAVKDDLFKTPWALTQVRWSPDSSRFTFLYNQRGHQVMRVVAVDGKTGEAKPIIDEQAKTFIDWTNHVFTRYLDDTGEILWMSERDGWCHLYLYDAKTGQVKNQITKGEWVVRGVDRVDDKARQVWFRAGGIRPGQDPYYVHFCRVNFDGTGLTILTEGDGTHRVEYSPDGKYLLDTFSRVDLAPVVEVRRTDDGARVCEVEHADVTKLAAAGWKPPEQFIAKGRDGTTDIYGVIFRPSNFDPAKKYPVIEDIYAGPQGAFVPKGFQAYYNPQGVAELGFIVVQIDGMGTNFRSKAFHDVCWKNLGDAGFPDRILWMKAAAEKHPEMDLSRVGLYGTSAGGQSALGGLLFHGDFYKAGVANCGCHDNRMDKIWWNEQWMGWPVGPHYAEQSNVTNAHKLTGKLMLFVGELDTNVDPASTMQVVNALIKANKDFDFLVFPGAGHGQIGAYGQRRLRDFFVRNLLGVEPRRDQ